MNISDWLRTSLANIRSDGVQGVQESLYPIYKKGLHQVFRLSPSGIPIYEEDWDLLIVLDGCRLDLMEEVASDTSYIEDVGSIRSVDTMTREWMKESFRNQYDDEMENTTFICGNPHSDWLLDNDDFQLLDEVWRYGWDDDLGTLPPRPVTDRAISVGRSESPERMILHYMQPHYPFVPSPGLDHGIDIDRFGELPWDNVWDRLRKGELNQEDVWEGYAANLRYVLEDIELLLSNFDANNVVITSDHGNALGEWGIYGHPIHMPIDVIRQVPWISTTAKDRGTHTPDITQQSVVDSDVENRLKQLGYHS